MEEVVNSKKVWMFHHYATPPTMSGLTRPYEFSMKLTEVGYNSTIFSASHLHYTGENLIQNGDLSLAHNEAAVPFVFIKTYSSNGNGIKRVFNMISYYINLIRVTKQLIKDNDKPDIIIASSPHPLTMLAGLKVAKKAGIPCICEVRDFWPEVFFQGGRLKKESFIGKILLRGERWIYKKSDALIFLKEGDVSYITENGWATSQGGDIDVNKCYYINNGVDHKSFSENIIKNDYDDEDLNSNKFNVIYAGAIRPVNNVGNIIDAAKLLTNYDDIQFLIYGDGNELEFLRNRVLNEDINNVKLKGYVDKKYVSSILSKSSVNVLNYSQSKYNWSRGNSSNKLFEYMASGKPIISTVKMGYSPIDKYDCGLTLETDTPQALADGIVEIYSMPRERYIEMSNNAQKGSRDFDYEELTKKLISVMERELI
ncbi:glycosyltransferase WbuB [Erysipelothrix larvae]|uniref:Glycosyltransferase WbuB n=1 Tax=Erysipelothrix larvae TaxID=1514105 RepID=A0A0X8H155_9FIRM|nr:glycosyltransferase family 4 protein [Erysipelothrix larvae]AMC94069.1 glycosyltransferase WbuB [Erysipelothrix larvae]